MRTYVDTTVALPLLTAYALTTRAPRGPRRLFARRDDVMRALRRKAAKGRKKHEGRTSKLRG